MTTRWTIALLLTLTLVRPGWAAAPPNNDSRDVNGNTAAGSDALLLNVDGRDNSAFGSVALGANTHGTSNTAVGAAALVFNDTGNRNSAIGQLAQRSENAALAARLTRLEEASQGIGSVSVARR